MPGSSSSSSSSPSPDRPPGTPNRKRRSTSSAAHPLQTISETQLPPPIPVKSSLRNGSSADVNSSQPPAPVQSPLRKWFDNKSSSDTRRTAPPAYEWVSAPGAAADSEYLDNGPVEGEKLARLRQAGGFRRNQKGGWLRLGLFLGIFLIAIALAVGLGVGLTVGRRHSSSDNSSGSAPTGSENSTANQPFPLGQYSIVTALRSVNTSCTSDAATWRCFPYSTYNATNPASAASSRATFNWLITNTSSTYATNTTGPTPDQGIPSNLSISATNNPFGITFSAMNLTYISPATNTSSTRYEFNFQMSKAVFPTSQITTDNIATECFFNQTTFTGILYLSSPSTYANSSDNNNNNSTETQWPYAVQVSQTSPAGSEIPTCYAYTNGAVGGAPVTNFITPLTAGTGDCTCDYRNY